MPRAHLSKPLPDAVAIQLFAEHHIVHVRRRKNGEIVAVKHSTFGWISPQTYYGLQKAHELIPIAQEVIKGGYLFKMAVWNAEVSVAGTALPVGNVVALAEVWNFWSELNREPKDWEMLLLRAYALFGPFGDVIQIIDSIIAAQGIFAGIGEWIAKTYRGPSQSPIGPPTPAAPPGAMVPPGTEPPGIYPPYPQKPAPGGTPPSSGGRPSWWPTWLPWPYP